MFVVVRKGSLVLTCCAFASRRSTVYAFYELCCVLGFGSDDSE